MAPGVPRRILLALCAALGALVAVPAAPAAAGEHVAPDQITVQGRGWGHGRGLSQWGSLGYAVDHGWSSAQILDHYYGRTTAGTAETQILDIHLTANANLDLLVTSATDFNIAGWAFTGGETARLSVQGENDFQVSTTTGCADPGTPVIASVAGVAGRQGHPSLLAVSANADPSIDDVDQMLVMIFCDSEEPATEVSRRAYRGQIGLVEIGGLAYAFNKLPIEQYLRGVVPRESPSWWGAQGGGAGIAALEAQAVAARSYAIRLAEDRVARGFFTHACDTTACQVYGGAALLAGSWLPLDHGSVYTDSNQAIVNTADVVRLRDSDGSVALTEFGSSSGGWTQPLSEGSGYPDVEDLGDAVSLNPHTNWTTTIQRSDVEAMFPSIGELTRIRVTRRNGLGEWGGRTRQILFEGTSGSETLNIDDWGDDVFRRAFGLRSDWYRFPDFPEVGDPGFWVAKSDGTVLALGSATHFGDASNQDLPSPVVDMAATASGQGYWLVTRSGDVYAYGDAIHIGAMSGLGLAAPIVAMAPHPDGQGYWFTASDGGVFAFGSAAFHGSMGEIPLNQPVVGMESTASGNGYWLVASDGGIFAFGDAQFHGSTGHLVLNQPITSMTAAPGGSGYWFVALDGGVFSFGAVDFHGSRGDRDNRRPIAGMAVTTTGGGYWLVMDDGTSYPFGDAPDFVSSVAGQTVVAIEVVPPLPPS